nr:DUF3102 domain-containing protein [Bacillus sp. LNXM65]
MGRRLKHVKENDLAHSEWIKWLESVEIERTLAKRLMQVYDQFGKWCDVAPFANWKTFRNAFSTHINDRQEFIDSSTGETKTVDEMTVREVKKALKEAEQE